MPATPLSAKPLSAVSGTPASFWSRVAARIGLMRQRRALAELEDHLLMDIGVSRAEAEAESRRMIWDGPARG